MRRHGRLFRNPLQQIFEAIARAINFLGEFLALGLNISELLTQLPIFIAQGAAQLRGLANLVFQGGNFCVHKAL